jgi:hypothetical protein
MKKISISVLLGIFLVLGASAAFAGETQKESNWDFNLAPLYLISAQYLTTLKRYLHSILREYTEATGGFSLITVILISVRHHHHRLH